MGLLICKKCKNGTLVWVDEEVSSLDGGMVCKNCGHTYHGMKDFLKEKFEGNSNECTKRIQSTDALPVLR